MPFRLGANRIGRLVVGEADSGLNIPTSGLYAWWDFNNPSSYTAGASTVTDLSGNGNDGDVGSVLTTGLDGGVRYIQSANIANGLTNAIDLAQDVTTDLATCSMFMVVKGTSATNMVLLQGSSNAYIAQNATGNFYSSNVGTPTIYSNTTLDSTVIEPTDGWKLRTFTNFQLTNSGFNNGVAIGGYASPFRLEAQIVAIAYYNRTLTAGEVSQIYTAYDTVIDLDT